MDELIVKANNSINTNNIDDIIVFLHGTGTDGTDGKIQGKGGESQVFLQLLLIKRFLLFLPVLNAKRDEADLNESR